MSESQPTESLRNVDRKAYNREAAKKHYQKLKEQGIPEERKQQYRANATAYYQRKKTEIKERRLAKMEAEGKEPLKQGRKLKEHPSSYTREYHVSYYQANRDAILEKARQKRLAQKTSETESE